MEFFSNFISSFSFFILAHSGSCRKRMNVCPCEVSGQCLEELRRMSISHLLTRLHHPCLKRTADGHWAVPWALLLKREKLVWGQAPQAGQGQPVSMGRHRPVRMFWGCWAEQETWQVSTYVECSSFEIRNMEIMELNGFLLAVLSSSY